MLDEFREYDIYLDLNEMSKLFRNDNLKDSLSGLRRPLLILARGFLGLCQKEKQTLPQAVSSCKSFLWAWLGGEMEEPLPEMPAAIRREIERAADNSFAKYIEGMKTTTSFSKETLAKMAERLNWKRTDFRHSPFSGYALEHENDAKRIYGDQILADAMVKGPLRKQYLAIANPQQASRVCGNDTQWKLCRAMIGWYLQERSEEQQYAVITMSEISNWIDTPATSKGMARDGSPRPSLSGLFIKTMPQYEGSPLLCKYNLMSNTVKLTVNSRWLEDYQVCLITDEQIPEYVQKGFAIYADSLMSTHKGLKLFHKDP
jgi:hypothetical protein